MTCRIRCLAPERVFLGMERAAKDGLGTSGSKISHFCKEKILIQNHGIPKQPGIPLSSALHEYFEYLIDKYQTHMSFDKDPFLQEIPQKKLAVLIDADNAQPEIIEGLLAEIALYGIASVKRIYGNWTTPNLQPWKEVLLNYSIQPIQQFDYTKGKNATDSALIIDAMDLLYTNKFDGFCIVSSDSDFTRLAQRIRESGLLVYGFGERKTPKPFVQACDKFVYTEILRKTG